LITGDRTAVWTSPRRRCGLLTVIGCSAAARSRGASKQPRSVVVDEVGEGVFHRGLRRRGLERCAGWGRGWGWGWLVRGGVGVSAEGVGGPYPRFLDTGSG
jgi:hypothetical protein